MRIGQLCGVLAVLVAAMGCAEATCQNAPPNPVPNPVLLPRPTQAGTRFATDVTGLVRLDMVVTDAAGKVVTDLGPGDFTVLDNGQAQKVTVFHGASPDVPETMPAQMILVIDTVNTGVIQLGLQRAGMQRYFRQNGGHLALPTSIFWLTDAGLKVQPKPTTDGNALANFLDRIDPTVHTIRNSAGGQASIEKMELSLRSLLGILTNLEKQPRRKLVIWTGVGWPSMAELPHVYSARTQQLNYDGLREMTNGLREARVTLCTPDGGDEFYSRRFLNPVTTADQVVGANLSLPALALSSGGITLNPGNGGQLETRLAQSVASAGPFYSLVFKAPAAKHAAEYHQLAVKVSRPGLKVRTNAAYFAGP